MEPDWAVAPGETLREALDERGLSQAWLARETGFSPKHVNQVVLGNAAISVDFALALERALGISAKFWMNLEVNYQLGLRRLYG